jgi:hypothetical protein
MTEKTNYRKDAAHFVRWRKRLLPQPTKNGGSARPNLPLRRRVQGEAASTRMHPDKRPSPD